MAADGAPFPYMQWAKANLDPAEPLSLGLSGLSPPPAGEVPQLLPSRLPDGSHPGPALREALGRRQGLGPESVHLAAGTSHANFLAYLAFARGGHVAAETPTYEAFHHLGAAVGATVAAFRRSADHGYRIDPESFDAALEEGTRLIAVTDLHNPSGARLHGADLDLMVEAAERLDALVLVDEVYLELDPLDRPTAARRHPRILTTNSLTKAHGLPELRAGWILGDPDRIRVIQGWDDLVCPVLPTLPMLQALAFLPHAAARLAATREAAARRTDQVDAWVQGRADVWWHRPEAGFTGFLRLGRADHALDAWTVAERCHTDSGVRVVPGTFFQSPAWIRISYLRPEEELAHALDGLGRALDALAR
ncbi:MAG: pyridoxal phosphate-dependent aminotransferase [Planctomycetota bacterium]|jgi:aspartate/methionine/tyrosine aminotransferase